MTSHSTTSIGIRAVCLGEKTSSPRCLVEGRSTSGRRMPPLTSQSTARTGIRAACRGEKTSSPRYLVEAESAGVSVVRALQ